MKYKDYYCLLEYERVNDNLMKYKRLSCNKDYSNKIDEELKNRFRNTFKFSNNDINKFILLLRKVVFPHEHMMNGKFLMKHHCQKKMISIVT